MKEWFKAAGIRALKTAAQVGVLLIGSDVVNIVSLDWPYIIGCMLGGAVLSMLTSVAGIPEVDEGASVFAQHAKDEESE